MSHSRLRRSISCIAAGLLIVGPVAVFFGGDLVDWHPHKIVVVTLATMCIAGIVWLFDEIRDIRAEQKLASINPFRAWNPEAFDKGAKINRWADELRRVAAKELTGSEVVAALQTALGNEVARSVLQRNPNFSPDQKRYVIDEVLNAVCPGVREAAYMAANLPAPAPYDEERQLTSEEFHQLTLRIINAATQGNVPVSDALSATAKAMGAIICILAERPGISAEDLVKFSQRAVAEFTQDAMTERTSQRGT
jgi:hypothetical protein